MQRREPWQTPTGSVKLRGNITQGRQWLYDVNEWTGLCSEGARAPCDLEKSCLLSLMDLIVPGAKLPDF